MDLYQQTIYKSRYARYLWDQNRREDWPETVGRYFDFFEQHLRDNTGYQVPVTQRRELETAVLNLEVMPSMRALMTAGEALKRTNVAGYNCAFLAVDSLRAFDEAMYVLTCGTGVGYSIQRKYVSQLPPVPSVLELSRLTPIEVEDSKEGWAAAFRELLECAFRGEIREWDMNKIRGAGEPLKTFGGRASGPEPLERLFRFTVQLLLTAQGRQLTPLECHDLMCMIGDIVVVGGVRRSALISISDLDDEDMRLAKSGEWWKTTGYRRLANNTAFHPNRPSFGDFLREWASLHDSYSGERGIFNHAAALMQIQKHGRRQHEGLTFGLNPCAEVLLRPMQFCNLSEAVVRPRDTYGDLKHKVRAAAVLGTWQSTLTNFPYLSERWQINTAEERLLGVSLTGMMDHRITREQGYEMSLEVMRDQVNATNAGIAALLGIPVSAATTLTKPSGTVSEMVHCSPGMNESYAPYYIRTIRNDMKDPVTEFLMDHGIPHEPDLAAPNDTMVFSFPRKAPEGALTRHDLTAIQKLEIWKRIKTNWCEHNPSTTVNVKDNEWMDVGKWVWDNFDTVVGVSFLPYDGGTYKQAPYQECSKEQYEAAQAAMPVKLDWDKLSLYEDGDQTKGAQELACVAGVCTI